MQDNDELVPRACAFGGKYKLVGFDGNEDERWITADRAYLMLNNLEDYKLISMTLINKQLDKSNT